MPAVFGDELEGAPWATDMNRASTMRRCAIRRLSDWELLVWAHVLWVWLGLASGPPVGIPAGSQVRLDGNDESAFAPFILFQTTTAAMTSKRATTAHGATRWPKGASAGDSKCSWRQASY